MAADENVSFVVGQMFATFSDFEKTLHEFEQFRHFHYYKRDSRTVEAARKRLTRNLSETLVYYEVRYCCEHGGKKFKHRGQQKRTTM